MIYKHLVIVAALVFWATSVYMVRKWPGGKDKSFSLHAANNRQAYTVFAVAVSIETALYLLFIFKWFIPMFDMPFIFGLLTIILSAGHFITGIIPETKGLTRQIHRKASYSVAWLFIPTLFILAITTTIPVIARVLAGIFTLATSLMMYLHFTKLETHRQYLMYQAIYIATLPTTLIAATYLR